MDPRRGISTTSGLGPAAASTDLRDGRVVTRRSLTSDPTAPTADSLGTIDPAIARMAFAIFLREGREASGMTLEDVARITKIQRVALERLEAGLLDELPADVFVRGFVRNYARCIGLDVDDALRRYGDCGRTPGPAAAAGSSVELPLVDDGRPRRPTGPVPVPAAPRILRASGTVPIPPLAPSSSGSFPRLASVSGAPLRDNTPPTRTSTTMTAVRVARPSSVMAAVTPIATPIPAPIPTPILAPRVDRPMSATVDLAGQPASDLAISAASTAAAAMATVAPAVVVAVPAPVAESERVAKAATTETPSRRKRGRRKRRAQTAMARIDASNSNTVAAPVASIALDAVVDASDEPLIETAIEIVAEPATEMPTGRILAAIAALGHDRPAEPEAIAEPIEPIVTRVVESKATTMRAATVRAAAARAATARAVTSVLSSSPVVSIDDDDPDRAERELEARASAEREPSRRSFLPPSLLDNERGTRQGGLTLAVIILLIVATLTLSYLMRRPSSSGEGVTQAPAALALVDFDLA